MIEGVDIVSVPTFVDVRGFINQIIQAADGVFPKLGRLSLVGNFGKGIIRRFHKHEKEWKCLFVIKSGAKFILVREKPAKFQSEFIKRRLLSVCEYSEE